MKVCIAGGGRVGMYLAQSLLSHHHKVTIIEPQEALCRTLADTLDIPVICGDSLSFDTLRTADVASCDAFVAVTGNDEDNLVACQIAKREFGVNRTVARASNPKNRDILHTLGVDTVVCGTDNLSHILEREIETDRRIIRNRISKLKEDLQKIDRQMAVQRSNRGSMVRVALVGYTNVGKSTLMNLISKSEVFAENKLFATLDTTVRKVVFDNLPFLLSDTVGFIRKLPTELIESFKSTLDEVREADLLVHVVDISHPQFEEQIDVVKQTLQEIGAGDKPVYLVFNKVDAYTYVRKDDDDLTPATRENLSLDDLKKSWIARANTPCIFLSALAKTNLEKFRSDLYGMVREIHAGRYPFNNFLY